MLVVDRGSMTRSLPIAGSSPSFVGCSFLLLDDIVFSSFLLLFLLLLVSMVLVAEMDIRGGAAVSVAVVVVIAEHDTATMIWVFVVIFSFAGLFSLFDCFSFNCFSFFLLDSLVFVFSNGGALLLAMAGPGSGLMFLVLLPICLVEDDDEDAVILTRFLVSGGLLDTVTVLLFIRDIVIIDCDLLLLRFRSMCGTVDDLFCTTMTVPAKKKKENAKFRC